MAVVPKLQVSNAKLLKAAQENMKTLEDCAKKLLEAAADPANDHAVNKAAIKKVQDQVDSRKTTLQEEMALRQRLDTALQANDKPAADAAQKALKDHRTANAKQYGASLTLAPTQPCRSLKVKPVQRPDSVDNAADLITGVFEGGKPPDYCAIADSPTDAGGLSYGKHQAAEKKGPLHAMLTQYVNATDPKPDAGTKAKVETHLGKFNKARNLYEGSAADRAAFKQAMKEACSDPAMHKTQDDFFAKDYLDPAKAAAKKLCVSSPLGIAMLYDIAIQSGPGRINGALKKGEPLATKAMKRLKKPDATQAQPCDPDGPTEAEFLQALNDERRDFVTSLGGDAAKSTYREDFFDKMLKAGNNNLDQDFVVLGVPVKGLPKGP